MVNGKILVEKLVAYAKNFLYLHELDEVYTRNVLLGEFGLISAETNPKIDDCKCALCVGGVRLFYDRTYEMGYSFGVYLADDFGNGGFCNLASGAVRIL